MIDNDNDTIVNDEDTYNMIPSIAPKAKIKRRKSPLRSSSPVVRIYKLLASRLSSSLLASLILLPILPSGQKNVVFELIPLYKSLSALLARPHHTRHNHAARRQKRLLLLEQWLSYWTIYASLKFLENTRCNISTSQQRWRTLHNIIDILPHILKEKIGNLILLYTSRRPVAPPSPPPTIPSTSHNKSRDMTLATQLAGSPARWTILKCIVLFYSMDEELQGARWILNKIIRPIAGFFTGLDDGDGDIEDDEATFLLPHESGEALEGEDQDMDRESTGHLTKHNLSKPSSRHTHFPSTTRTTIPTRHDVDKAEADEQAEVGASPRFPRGRVHSQNGLYLSSHI